MVDIVRLRHGGALMLVLRIIAVVVLAWIAIFALGATAGFTLGSVEVVLLAVLLGIAATIWYRRAHR